MKQLFIILISLFFSSAGIAQLKVDPSFNPSDHGGGKHTGAFGGDWGVNLGLILPNGKILIGGFYGFMHDEANNGVSLLNPNGSIDPSFLAPGINDNLNDGVTAMIAQPDGKIILGGFMTIYLGQAVHHILRINPNGSIDTSFHIGTGFTDPYHDIPRSFAVQEDGKIIVGGEFTHFNGNSVNGLLRLNTDGSLDTSFNFFSDTTAFIKKVAVDANGKIIVGGSLIMHSNSLYRNIAKLNTDGSLDESFYVNNDVIVNQITALALQDDNKVVFSCDDSVYRVDASGNIDTGFTKGMIRDDFHIGIDREITDIKIQSSNKILLCGSFTSYNNNRVRNILKLNTDGSIDNSFSTGTGFGADTYGGSADGRIDNIELFDDGRIFIAGEFLFYRGVWQGTMAELNNDGSISQTFNADNGNGADANVNKIAIQPDNKILIAGYFSDFNGVKRNKIARLNIDGTLDNSFNPGTGPDSCNYLNTVVLQKDGKILVGGNFGHFNGIAKSLIVRLNADGSLDNTFSFTAVTKDYGELDDGVRAIAVQADGKIIIGFETGYYAITEYNKQLLLRLNTDGSIDNSFNADALNNNNQQEVYSIKIQKDNKIILAGEFKINGANTKNLIRLNNDGSLDNTFNPNGSGTDGSIYAAEFQKDGKILIAGDFGSYNNIPINKLARVNIDGSLDQSYSPIIPDVENDINYISFPYLIIDENDKVLFSYLYFADTIFDRITRYNTDGVIDSIFGTDNKADFIISDMAMQNEKLLASGYIESFNGVKRNHITRITTPEILPVTWVSVDAVIKNINDVDVTWQTANELNVKNYTVQKSINGLSFSNLIAELPGKGINNKYLYKDLNGMATLSKAYYRILETDNDGKKVYSQIAFVTKDESNVITIAPNPAHNFLHISNLNSTSVNTLIIINSHGDVVNTLISPLNNVDINININELSSGAYFIKITSGSSSYLYKFVKE